MEYTIGLWAGQCWSLAHATPLDFFAILAVHLTY